MRRWRDSYRAPFAEKVGLDEVVSMTATTNRASQAVMRRLGMTHDPRDDFDHPSAPPDSPLRRHVLWRMSRERWRTQRSLDTRRTPGGAERVDALEPQVSLAIPRGTAFQFRCTGHGPLRILGATAPAWGGDEDAEHVEGHWPAALQA